MTQFAWQSCPSGVQFAMNHLDEAVPADRWALHKDNLRPSERSAIPVLLGLIENDVVREYPTGTVIIPHAVLASQSSSNLVRLGLPHPAPCTVSIENEGLLTDPSFRIRYALIGTDARPILGWKRDGVFLHVGSRTWLLQDPLFSLVESIDAFNAEPSDSMDGRFLAWSQIRQLLPEDAVVDGYLRETQVALATAFTLDVHADASGQLTFEPILVRPRSAIERVPDTPSDDAAAESAEGEIVRSLPDAASADFARQFSRFQNARGRYALPGGWFVAVEPHTRDALQVVREMQEAPPAQRRAFVTNPHAVLREKLASKVPEEAIEALFFEPADYGDRVAAAGAWEPKILPFLRQASQPWLPPDEMGLLIDGAHRPIDPSDMRRLMEQVAEAIQQGRSSVTYQGTEIPANEQTIGALQALAATAGEVPESQEREDAPPKQAPQHVLLLQEKDNLDSLVYCPTSKRSRPGTTAVPGGLRNRLKPHQLQGLEWLQQHWLSGARGALLADDMGLGKTLQVLAFLLWIRQTQAQDGRTPKPILVAAPPGLLANWADEHTTHLEGPGIGSPLRAYGDGLRAIRRPETKGLAELLVGAPVLQTSVLQESSWVLTTYETVRDYSHSFGRVRWDVAIFDEAQKIKNPCALITEEAKAVASSASFVIAMTGTPVENRLSDLWSLADTCEPGALLDLRRFVSKFDTHRDSSGDAIVKLKDEITHTEFPISSAPRLMLRRMKWQELRGLPEKRIETIRCTMPDEQAVAYARAVKRVRDGVKSQAGMLQALHAIRSISLHPRPDAADDPDAVYIAASARLTEGFKVLDRIHDAGERALIFIESRALQPIVQGIIQRRYNLDHPPMLINGDVAGDRRRAMVRKFQDGGDFDCMILSPKAGGVGLTLTSANHVIHLTRWWNPAVEDQCTDRVYRIGQEKTVHVHIPMAIHPEIQDYSFDVRLDALLQSKRDLSRRVLGLAPSTTSAEDLSALYSETIGENQA
jgi:hypothetical protein